MHRYRAHGRRATPLAGQAFRRLWLASVLSAAGDAASWVAMAALVLSEHGSLPLLAVLYTAPVAAGGLAAGWALDRFDRRRLLAADAAVRGAIFAAIPLAAAAGTVGPGQVYATAASYGLLKMIGLAGFPAIIPQLVGADLLPAANALEGAGFGVATVTGPALAGAMLGAGLPPVAVIAADAATSFVLVATLLVTPVPHGTPPAVPHGTPPAVPHGTPPAVPHGTPPAVPHGTPPARAAHRQQPRSAMREVIRLAIRHPVIRDTTIMFALANIGDGALLIVLAHQARRAGLGSGGYGWLIAAMAGGELAAALVLLRLRWRAPLTASILVAQLAAAGATAGLLPPSRLSTVIALIMLGFCTAPMTAWAQTLRMQAAPPSMHGRLFALLRTTMQATPPAGAAMAGILLHAGQDAAVIGIITIIAAPALLLAPNLLRSQPAEGHNGLSLRPFPQEGCTDEPSRPDGVPGEGKVPNV